MIAASSIAAASAAIDGGQSIRFTSTIAAHAASGSHALRPRAASHVCSVSQSPIIHATALGNVSSEPDTATANTAVRVAKPASRHPADARPGRGATMDPIWTRTRNADAVSAPSA
jgi:hypothetical protein